MISGLRVTRILCSPRWQRKVLCPQFSSSTNLDDIKDEFTRQAAGFENHWSNRSNKSTTEIMSWVMKHVHIPDNNKMALDVAAGTCIFARTLAPHYESVTALDTTSAMLEQGQLKATSENISNMEFVVGDASKMPFPDNTFDTVVCRLCVHHFDNPIAQFKEMSRVLKPGGNCVVADIVSSVVDTEADEHNRLEILRDPSHTVCITPAKIIQLLQDVGLETEIQSTKDSIANIPTFINPMNLAGWMESTNTPPHAMVKIERAFEIELNGGSPTGMQAHRDEDGNVCFNHVYVVAQGYAR